MRLGPVIVVVAWLLAAASARADSVVVVDDYSRAGIEADTHVWETPGDAVTAARYGNGVGVDAGGSSGYGVALRPAVGDVLTAGRVYDHAGDGDDERRPILEVSGGGSTCRGGRFEVFELAFAGDTVSRLSAVFECPQTGGYPTRFGEIRIGETGDTAPGRVRWPLTDAGTAGTDVPVRFTAPQALTVSSVALAGADAGAFAKRADGCAGKALAAGGRCTVTVGYPASGPGTKRAALRFSLSDGSTRDVALDAFAYGGTTRVTYDSEPGDPVGGGADAELAGPAVSVSGDLSQIRAVARSGDTEWVTSLAAAGGDVLAAGTYEDVAATTTRAGPASLGVGRTAGSVTHSCQNGLTQSRFTVEDLRTWPSGDLRSFGGRFLAHCDGASGALRGTVQFRAGDTTALPPWVDESPGPAAPTAGSATFYGDPDGYVGQGAARVWRDATVTGTGAGLYAQAGNGADSLRVEIQPPEGASLGKGVYVDTVTHDAGDAGHAELDVSMDGLASGGGRFEILDWHQAPDGTIDRLWLVYEGNVPAGFGGGGWAGEIRYGMAPRSLVPARVRFAETDAGRPTRTVPAELVAPRALTTSAATVAGSGRFAVRRDDCGGRALAAGERCRIWVRDTAGTPGVATGTLRLPVVGGGAFETELEGFAWGGTTRLQYTGAEGDGVTDANHRSGTFTPADARFDVSAFPERFGLILRAYDDTTWNLFASAPAGGSLPGAFTGAHWFFNSSVGPWLAFAHSTSGCRSLGPSSFAVEDFKRFPNGRPRSLAMSFTEHCDDREAAVTGTFEFRHGDTTTPAPWIGPGAQPSPSPSPTPTATASASPTSTPVGTPAATGTATPGPESGPAPTATPDATPSPTPPHKATCSKRCRTLRKRHRAIKRCARFHGRRHHRCMRKARAIGRKR